MPSANRAAARSCKRKTEPHQDGVKHSGVPRHLGAPQIFSTPRNSFTLHPLSASPEIVSVQAASFWSLWYFHVPNFILAVVMYTMLGRALLGLFVEHNSQNYIWRGFCAITDPFLKAFALVTPKAAAPVVQWLFGFVWMFWLRVLLLVVFFSLGILRVGAP